MENKKVFTFSLLGNKGERSLLRENYPTTQIAAQNLLYVISWYFEGGKTLILIGDAQLKRLNR